MIPQDVREIAQQIGVFYLRKNDNNYEKTAEEISNLQIVQLSLETTNSSVGSSIESENKVGTKKTLTITTARPGSLIGKCGTNIDELTKYLKETHKIDHIKIVECRDNLIDWLIPQREEELDYSYDCLTDEEIDDLTSDPYYR
ncbi:hypothetical protein C4565_00785 [Candidatus Parcubacteria bacterium]|nr:MAG: hypothetical protein C4565_00785 [Candidatus Parcubacteria bacterium]